VAFFLITSIISWRVYFKVYRQSDKVNIHLFPKVIEGWTAEELIISEEEKAILETDNTFVRRYTNNQGEEVFLFIVYSENNRKVSHPPEICYTGGGATILNSVPDAFYSKSENKLIRVNKLTVERGRVTQIFVYWFKVGDAFTFNYWKQQGLIAIKSLFGKPASSALIRISSTVNQGNADEAGERINKFSQLISPYIHQYLP
jgi:EpsI family protein